MALRSDDPYDAPKLDIGYLTDKEGADLATLRSAAPQLPVLDPVAFLGYMKPQDWESSTLETLRRRTVLPQQIAATAAAISCLGNLDCATKDKKWRYGTSEISKLDVEAR